MSDVRFFCLFYCNLFVFYRIVGFENNSLAYVSFQYIFSVGTSLVAVIAFIPLRGVVLEVSSPLKLHKKYRIKIKLKKKRLK